MKMQAILDRLGACAAAREWVGARTLSEAWAECERPDWLLWLHSRSVSADASAYAELAKKWAWAAEAPAWAAARALPALAAEAAAAARARQCEDVRAALCLPVFNTPGEGGKDEVTI